MIFGLRYDEGEPHFMVAIGKWTEGRRPSWRCNFREDYRGQGEELEAWLRDNMSDTYECLFRFNSGDPCYFIHIYGEDDLTAFRLRWS